MSDDLISREDTKQAIRHKFKTLAERCEINEVLNSMPSVQPEQKTGIWIDCPFNNLMDKRMMCGQCGSVETNLNHTNYCPNCGADMRGGEANG